MMILKQISRHAWEVFSMELPKNITQIGEIGGDCRVYVEDYVVSYMKQLNRAAQDKEMAAALYGRCEVEDGVTYYFAYGACKLDFLQREARHLSQAQRQEAERLRRKYFPELTFLGYRILNGEMIEGVHICEQDICRYIAGYAQFYEKNDAMLAYMLDVREEAEPEQVNQDKYEEVKKRQEQRRQEHRQQEQAHQEQSRAETIANMRGVPASANLQKMRVAAVGVFALLCLAGIATFREDEVKESPTAEETQAVAASVADVTKDRLVMEDKLEQALLQENQIVEAASESTGESVAAATEETAAAGTENKTYSTTNTTANTPTEAPTKTSAEIATAASDKVSEAVAYVIQTGDTLIGISRRQYGSDVRVDDICSLNKISDPDDIKVGQVIMLPQ
jgi:nucleoid-associated protein YgaU